MTKMWLAINIRNSGSNIDIIHISIIQEKRLLGKGGDALLVLLCLFLYLLSGFDFAGIATRFEGGLYDTDIRNGVVIASGDIDQFHVFGGDV